MARKTALAKALDALLLYSAPVLAVGITALVFVGPGAERTVRGGRVRGVLVEGAEAFAVRLEVAAHFHGMHELSGARRLELEVRDGAAKLGLWHGSTDERGHAEAHARLARPLGKEVTLRLRDVGDEGDGALLAEVTVPTRAPLPRHDPRLALSGETSGWPIAVSLPRGLAVAPFAEQVDVEAEVPPEAGTLVLEAEATGGDAAVMASPPAAPCTEAPCKRRWRLAVTPRADAYELRLKLQEADAVRSRFRGPVPATLGKLWLDPARAGAGEIAVRSAIPREQVHVSLLGTRGRLWGGRVLMRNEASGFAEGRLALPTVAEGPLTVLLSSDENEAARRTAAWPFAPQDGMVEPVPLALLHDALPPRVEREKVRRDAARRPVYGLLLAAGLFEMLLLLWRNRRERARLEADFAKALDDGEAPAQAMTTRTPLFWAVLGAGALMLSFAALAAILAFG